MEPLDGWTGGVPGAQMYVRAYGRRLSLVDVRMFCACARGGRLLRVINIIIMCPPNLQPEPEARACAHEHEWFVRQYGCMRDGFPERHQEQENGEEIEHSISQCAKVRV